jgi:zinc protease
MMNQNHIGLFILLALCFISFQSTGQDLASLQPNDTIPLDPMVKVGKLDNGLTYYIRRNTHQRNKVTLNLVVKAGYDQEDADQDHLAHVLEHVPFTGTVNFPNPREYFDGKGVKRREFNAETHSNYTSYFISVTPKEELINDGLRFLHDCAGNILITPEKINKARRSTYNELRSGSGTSAQQQYALKIFTDAGKKIMRTENIKEFKDESLTRFYHDWYRPDLQAIMIVGDIDVEKMGLMVASLFSDLKNPPDPRPHQKKTYGLNRKTQVLTYTDPNQTETEIQIIMRRRKGESGVVQTYKEEVIAQLFDEMMNKRMNDAKNYPDFSSESASYQYHEVYDINGSAVLSKVIVKPSKIKEGFEFSIKEFERIRRYGFSEAEVERAKSNVSPYNDISTGTILDDYILHFVAGRRAPNIEFRNRLLNYFNKEITTEDVNRVTTSWVSDTNRDIVIFAPSSAKELLPNETMIMQWADEAKAENIQPYKLKKIKDDITVDRKLLDLKNSVTFHQHEIPAIGVTDIVLSNGLRIVLRPVANDDPDSVIHIHGFRKGGASAYQGTDYTAALLSVMLVNQSGIGAFNQSELNEFIANKDLSIYPYITRTSNGIRVSSKTSNIETAMYFIHQYFSNPAKDNIVFQNLIASEKASLLVSKKNVYGILLKAIDEQLANINFKTSAANPADLDKINIDRMYDIYREQFGNARDFSFVISGNFDRKKIIPIVAKYLSALPSKSKKEIVQLPAVTETKGFKRTTLYGPLTHDQASVQLKLVGPFKRTEKNILLLDILHLTLQDLLTKRLRMKDGSVYGVSVEPERYRFNNDIYTFTIAFTCAAAEVERIVSDAKEEISSVAKGIAPELFAKVITFERDQLLENRKSYDFWMTYLGEQIENDQPLTGILNAETLLNKMSPGDVQSAAKEYLTMDRLMEFVILPEARNPSTSK